MSGEYTDAEIKARLAEVVDQTISIDRRSFTSSEFIVDSLKAMVSKTLGAENDAFYYVLKLFTTAQAIKCQSVLTHLDNIERLAFISNQEIPLADPIRLQDILDTYEEIAEANSSAEISHHVTRLTNLTKSLINDSRRGDGSIYTGYDPSEAKESASASLTAVSTLLPELSQGALNFIDAPKNYSQSDLKKYPLIRMAQRTKKLLSRYVEETTQDPLSIRVFGRARLNLLAPIRDVVLINSVINRRSANIDVNEDKYDDTVTTVGRDPAVLSGGTLPLTYPLFQDGGAFESGGSIDITIDGLYQGTITSSNAHPPVLRINPVPERVVGQEQGRFAVRDDDPLSTVFTSGVGGVPFLKTYTDNEEMEISYVDTNGKYHIISWDSQSSAFVDSEYPTNGATVTLVQETGSLSLDFSAPSADLPGDFQAITVKYSYYIIGDYTVRDSSGNVVAGTSPYNSFSVLMHNTLRTYQPSTAEVVTSDKELWADIAEEINASLEHGVSVSSAPGSGSVTMTSIKEGGSGTRIALPNYTTDTPILNTALWAPTWKVDLSTPAPLDLNRALNAVNSKYPAGFGRDLGLQDLVVSSGISDRMALLTSTTIVEQAVNGTAKLSYVDAAEGEVILTADTSSYAAGDALELTSPYRGVVKITEVVSSTELKVRPYVALNFDAAPTPPAVLGEALTDTPVVFDVTRRTLQIQSDSSAVSSSVSASSPTKGGFGFSGTANGASNEVTLTGSNTGKPIRAGDVVFQGNNRIGTVSSASGTTVRMNLDSGASATYPYASIRVESQGKVSYRAQHAAVQNSFLELSAMVEAQEYNKNISAFVTGGTGVSNFLVSLSKVRIAVTALKTAYEGYSANSVREVDHLIRTLSEEKLTLMLAYLRELNFSAIADMTAEELSTQSSMENLLEEISVALGSRVTFAEEIEGVTRMTDYFTRGDGLTIDEFDQE